MVKSPSPLSSRTPSKKGNLLRRWWRAILSALLVCLIAVPYTMGSDVKKYLRGWVEATNQGNDKFHIEIINYQRHWFTSEGELELTSTSLPSKINLKFIAYHGPLFINVGRPLRLGLGYFKGSFDSHSLLGQQKIVQAEGPIQITAFLPYFSDREVHANLPAITINDKENKLNYQLQTITGELDGDDLLQLQIPSIKIKHLDGSEVINLDSGLLRILPGSHLASFSAKQIDIHAETQRPATIDNLVIQANTQTLEPSNNKLLLNLNLHFDQLQIQLNPALVTNPLVLGPFEFNLGINGLQSQELTNLAQMLKTLSRQKDDLSPEQGEALEKNLAQLLAPDMLFKLNTSLNTAKGLIAAQFQGGFKQQVNLHGISDLVAAFYSQGNLSLAAEVKQTLLDYASQLDPTDHQDLELPTFLGFFKKDGQGKYTSQINIQNGKVKIGGKGDSDKGSSFDKPQNTHV